MLCVIFLQHYTEHTFLKTEYYNHLNEYDKGKERVLLQYKKSIYLRKISLIILLNLFQAFGICCEPCRVTRSDKSIFRFIPAPAPAPYPVYVQYYHSFIKIFFPRKLLHYSLFNQTKFSGLKPPPLLQYVAPEYHI